MRKVTLTKHSFGEDTTDEDIAYWQEQGVEKIFAACWQLSLLGFEMQGDTSGYGPLDKSVFVKHPVPWVLKDG